MTEPKIIKSFPGQAVEEWRKRHHGFLPSQELEWIDSFITAIQAGLHDRCRDVEFEELKKLAIAGSHAIGQNVTINLQGVTGDEMDRGAERAAMLTRLMAAASSPEERAPEGDAYFIVGYEDTPGFAIARSKADVRAALCEVIYGGSLKPEDDETKEELDQHMEWFEDDDNWSIDRSRCHLSDAYEIGGLEVWRFPARLLATSSPQRTTEKS